MKIRKNGIAFIFSILFVLSHAQIIPTILLISDVISWSLTIWNTIKASHEMISSATDSCDSSREENYYLLTNRLFETVTQISTQLVGISQLINDRTNELKKIIQKLGLDIDINRRMDNLVQKMDIIENRYEDLVQLQQHADKPLKFDAPKLCRFAYRQLYEDLLKEKVDSVYRIVVPFRDLQTSLLAEIYEDFEAYTDKLCGTGHSTLDYLHLIYTSLMIVEIKAFVMTAFSHHILFHANGTGQKCEYYEKNPDNEIKMAQINLREHLQGYSEKFLEKMEGASREFRACDQEQDFKRDETYFELEGAIQTIIQPATGESDELGCEDIYDSYGTHGIYCDGHLGFCTTPVSRNCLGYISNCRAPDYRIYGCLAAENSSRRYEWIETEGYAPLAQTSSRDCAEKFIMGPTITYGRSFIPHFPYVLSKPLVKKPCLCECNDNDVDSLSTHIINLQWVESDVSENMIITGIRFIVQHRIMQFQIQQGELSSNFRVGKPKWKPVKDIGEEIRAARLNTKLRGESPGLIQNRDYLIVEQGINDAINFDTLNVSHPHILTGVRFYYSPQNKGGVGRIQIAIKGTQFDHITGKLCDNCDPEIVTSQIRHTQRYTYPRKNVKHPQFPTVPIALRDQYVHIDVSDSVDDAGQTTLPYFDALPLVSNPPFPLGGLGIFHKGSNDFTGFVSLKFVSLDYPTYIKKSVEEVQKQEELYKISTKSLHSLQHGPENP